MPHASGRGEFPNEHVILLSEPTFQLKVRTKKNYIEDSLGKVVCSLGNSRGRARVVSWVGSSPEPARNSHKSSCEIYFENMSESNKQVSKSCLNFGEAYKFLELLHDINERSHNFLDRFTNFSKISE